MSQEIRPLTGLRGLAACYVVVYHYHNDAISPATALGQVFVHGYLAVDLFFILSGFVMAYSYAKLFRKFSAQNYIIFLVRRIARIYPLYVMLLCLVWVGDLFGVGRYANQTGLTGEFVLNVLLIQYWGVGYSLNGPSWTISTEFAAYILFPALLLVAVRSRSINAVIVGTLAFSGLVILSIKPAFLGLTAIQYGPLDITQAYSPWPLTRCLLEFTIGLLAFRMAGQLPRPKLVSTAAALGIVALLTVPGAEVVLVALFAVLIASLMPSAGLVARILGAWPIHQLGVLSYAIYMLHYEFMRFERLLPPHLAPHLGQNGARIATEVIVLTALLGTAAFCYRFIEVPGRAIVRLWARRLDGPTPA